LPGLLLRNPDLAAVQQVDHRLHRLAHLRFTRPPALAECLGDRPLQSRPIHDIVTPCECCGRQQWSVTNHPFPTVTTEPVPLPGYLPSSPRPAFPPRPFPLTSYLDSIRAQTRS